jgi:hypothetical protein
MRCGAARLLQRGTTRTLGPIDMIRALAILLALSLGYATPASATVTKSVGGEKFCIPESRVVNEQLPYIQDVLPDDGFVFELPAEFLRSKTRFVPQLDVRGKEMPLIGSMSSAPPAKHSADSHARKTAASNKSVVEPIGNRYLAVFESAERKNWVIWMPAKGAPLSRSSINDSAIYVASCAIRGTDAKVCTRRFTDGKHSVSYHFDYANAAELDALDKVITNELRAWRCPHGA